MKEKYLALWAALALAAGIWLEGWFGAPLIPLVMGGIFCLAASALAGMRGRAGTAWLLLLVFAVFAGMARMELAERYWESQSQAAQGSEGTYSAVVTGDAAAKEGEEPVFRYLVELESIRYTDGEERPLRGAAYLYVPRSEAEQALPPDTRVLADGRLSPVRLYKNPGKMDLESRYKSQRIIGRIYAESEACVKPLGDAGEYRMEALAAAVREKLRNSFAPFIDPGRLPLLMTLLFGGNYEALPPGVLESFQATGIVHILSVSGSHMALLFGFLCLIGKWLRLPERAVFPIAAVLMLFYGALAGFVPPVVRAAAMGVLSAAGLFFGRRKEAILLLAAAALGMLCWDPLYLYDVSFQLSVGASAGLLLFYERLRRWLSGWLPRPLAEGAALSLSAQALTVPIILYDFHVFPLYVVPANLLAAPLLDGVIILGLLASPAVFPAEALAGGLLHLADYFLTAAVWVNGWLASLPYASLPVGGLAAEETALYYAAVMLLYTRRIWTEKAWGKAAAGGSLLLLLGWNAWSWQRQSEAEFFVPDLGVPRAGVLVRRDLTVLYYRDGGLPYDMGQRELLSVLNYKGIFKIDIFIGDFSEGKELSPFTLAVPVREIWLAGRETAGVSRFIAAHPESRVRRLSAGRLRTADGAVYQTDGKSWYISFGETGIYLDGGTRIEGLPAARQRIWLGGGGAFHSALNDDTMKQIAPDFAIYAGNRIPQSGEDRDFFVWQGIPCADPWLDGMVTLSVPAGGDAFDLEPWAARRRGR